MNSLKGRVALITGVSRKRGSGYGIAKRLADMGADLFLHSFAPYDKDRDPSDSLFILQTLSDSGIKVEQKEADFFDPESPARLMQAAVERFAHIDILVVNHTYSAWQSLEALTAEDIDRHLIINVRGSLLLLREFVKQHDGRPGGRVILMTSGQHLSPMPRELAYVASKGALHQLTLSLSELLIEKGITVNTVNPGPTHTWKPGEEEYQQVLQRMPQGRWGEPDDAARLISWLVSDDGVWITGQVINSAGGFRPY